VTWPFRSRGSKLAAASGSFLPTSISVQVITRPRQSASTERNAKSCRPEPLCGCSLAVQKHQVQLMKEVGIGNKVDCDDFLARYSYVEDDASPSTGCPHHPQDSIHEC
jgi:hypothetical protein